MGERWLPVPGYEGLYEVSDQGRIKSIRRPRSRGGLLNPTPNRYGYLEVSLFRNGQKTGCRVHQIVALAFIGPRPHGAHTRHLDGDSLNNTLANLTYGTVSENQFDRVRHGRHHYANRTHCANNHEYTEETSRMHRGARICLICARARSVAFRRRKREVAA